MSLHTRKRKGPAYDRKESTGPAERRERTKMTFKWNAATAAATMMTAALMAGTAMAEPKVLMLHQWASGNDAASIAKLGEMFEAKGGTWEQTAIAGHTANTLAKLRADVVAGNAPAAVQLKGPEIGEWNATGMTADMDELAAAEGWDAVVAPELLPVMKPDGKWRAAPMNIHRINWIWGNKAAMESVGVTELPKTWADFNAACEKAIAGGKVCLAHFSADWSDATTFETVVYGQDIDLYRKAFVEGDIDALRSEGMVKAFDQMKLMVSKYMDPAIAGRDYDTAANMMANGDALFYIMGDWELGRLVSLGKVPGEDMVIIEAMPVKSLVTFPKSGSSHLLAEQLTVRGHAWVGEGTVASAEVSLDFGITWRKAELDKPANSYAWQHWRTTIALPKKGYYEIWARAVDDQGRSQPMILPGWNPEGYLNNSCHRIAIQAV